MYITGEKFYIRDTPQYATQSQRSSATQHSRELISNIAACSHPESIRLGSDCTSTPHVQSWSTCSFSSFWQSSVQFSALKCNCLTAAVAPVSKGQKEKEKGRQREDSWGQHISDARCNYFFFGGLFLVTTGELDSSNKKTNIKWRNTLESTHAPAPWQERAGGSV